MLQRREENFSWDAWPQFVHRAVLGTQQTLVEAINQRVASRGAFPSDEAQAAGDIIELVGLTVGDAYVAGERMYSDVFESATHPALTEIAKRRTDAGKIDVITPRGVVDDLRLHAGFGKPKA